MAQSAAAVGIGITILLIVTIAIIMAVANLYDSKDGRFLTADGRYLRYDNSSFFVVGAVPQE